MKTWSMYLFKRIGFLTLLILLGIFLLYSLFDISTHLSDFYSKSGLKILETITYYSCSFIKEQEMFLSLAFLLASLFTAISLTTSKQIIALQAASISLRKAYFPMILLGLSIAGTLALSQQFVAPKAVSWIKQFKFDPEKGVSHLHISQIGSTRLFFSSYDKEKKLLNDCIWIFNHQKILRCKQLEITGTEPVVHYGHLIEWDGQLNQYIHQSIPHSKILSHEIREEHLLNRPTTTEEMSLIKLLSASFENSKIAARSKSLFLYRLSLSFFPLFLCMLWIPLCTSYSRTFSSLKVVLFALFSLILFFAIWKTLQILGENSVINPWIGFLSCFGVLSILATVQWRKIA